MNEYDNINREQEAITPGQTVMGLLMGVGAIAAIWFLSGLLQVL